MNDALTPDRIAEARSDVELVVASTTVPGMRQIGMTILAALALAERFGKAEKMDVYSLSDGTESWTITKVIRVADLEESP